ncbi:M4 family metallopeptidase [Pseudarthrobacter sulfonivorans]|uniref:M4 family metallopeptidase n=1 Tax=Pseudarthrobacter sulfonivorans TaxID=121292 RepID=UPI00285D38E2|nr:M4 family metallopeptidase [Pseudarthrobacter sulfonivorans]MDR6417035.1 Zn-dependent metalloprotease [Pseudarthrobacter sulfonivorans]
MSESLQGLHYHAAEDNTAARSPESFGRSPGGADDAPAMTFTSNEGAARYYLDQLLQRDDRAGMRSLTEPERPERVPSLVVESERDLPALGTHSLRFSQTYRDIPIFGAMALVELTAARDLVSVNGKLGEAPGANPVESLSRAEALEKVADYTGADIPAESGVGARLNFYKKDDDGSWHLAWFFQELPAEPPANDNDADTVDEALLGHGFGRRPVPPSFNYLVDAHDGEILFCYSAAPTALAIPARCTGIDENDDQQAFFGELVAPTSTTCRLNDPRRRVRTYDLQFADINNDPPDPDFPVEAPDSDYGVTNRAAVSAHANASRVLDFYNVVLQRQGIDDNGMDLVSLVNVTAASMQAPPSLLNAFWFRRRMWYGQITKNGRLVSLSRFLDVIGHELTHGVIETTSGLVYATQSGALNESFADIAGVIIKNWYEAPDRADVATWDWEIGPGLRADGRPLRDFADPSRTGHPKHMDDFRPLAPGELPGRSNDQGWVHFNSNIHNKAVHNLLTMSTNGARVFSVEDVAVLTYLGMARLTPRATFPAALQSVVDVGQTYFGGDVHRTEKIAAIRKAYQLVGIT